MRSVVVILVGLGLTMASAAWGETVTVGAAISLRSALGEIGKGYERETGVGVRLQFAGSGQLMAQVKNGAPIDVFIAAADGQVEGLLKEGLVLAEGRRVVAGNALVLIVPAGAKRTPAGLADLANAEYRRIAIGEPRTVPAGAYAVQALGALNVLEAVRPRLVHASNVRQVLDYVERESVSAGVVYRTDALESGERVRVAAVVEAKLHDPIRYTAVVVTASRKGEAARRFVDHLGTRAALAALRARGFVVEDATAAGGRQATAP